MAGLSRWAIRLIGAGLLGATAGIHAYLWKTDGYRHIPRIGPSFILLVVLASIACLAVAFLPGVLGRLAAVGGALLEAGTAIVLIVLTHHTLPGLKGFRESSHAPLYHAALTVEIIGFVVLGLLAAWSPSAHGRHSSSAPVNA